MNYFPVKWNLRPQTTSRLPSVSRSVATSIRSRGTFHNLELVERPAPWVARGAETGRQQLQAQNGRQDALSFFVTRCSKENRFGSSLKIDGDDPGRRFWTGKICRDHKPVNSRMAGL